MIPDTSEALTAKVKLPWPYVAFVCHEPPFSGCPEHPLKYKHKGWRKERDEGKEENEDRQRDVDVNL